MTGLEQAQREQRLREQLIRNFETIAKTREERAPLYDTSCARLGTGTAAKKLGISVDIVAPGKLSCPYHFHYAQEEAFVIAEVPLDQHEGEPRGG